MAENLETSAENEEIVICYEKSKSEANKRIGASYYNNPDCEVCKGYYVKCGRYIPTPPWFGKD